MKVNIVESTAVAERYDIRFIPTIALFDNGMIIARYVGPASRATLESILDSALARGAKVATVAATDRSVVGTLHGVMVLLRRLARDKELKPRGVRELRVDTSCCVSCFNSDIAWDDA